MTEDVEDNGFLAVPPDEAFQRNAKPPGYEMRVVERYDDAVLVPAACPATLAMVFPDIDLHVIRCILPSHADIMG